MDINIAKNLNYWRTSTTYMIKIKLKKFKYYLNTREAAFINPIAKLILLNIYVMKIK